MKNETIKHIKSKYTKSNIKERKLQPCCKNFLNSEFIKKLKNKTKLFSCLVMTTLLLNQDIINNYSINVPNKKLLIEELNNKENEKINLWSYNIKTDYLSDKDEEKYSWDNRKELIVEQVNNASPDIICFQEVTPNMFSYLSEELDNLEGNLQKRYENDENFGQAIFYNPERFQELESGKFYLSETPDEFSKGWNKDVRICAWIKLFDSTTNREFYVYNVHYTTHDANVQKASSELINERTKNLDAPVILAGDFNCTSFSEAYSEIDNEYTNSKNIALFVKNSGETYNGYSPTPKNWGPIDFIFLSETDGKSDFYVYSYERHNEYTDDNILSFVFQNGKYAISDHYAISTELFLKD